MCVWNSSLTKSYGEVYAFLYISIVYGRLPSDRACFFPRRKPSCALSHHLIRQLLPWVTGHCEFTRSKPVAREINGTGIKEADAIDSKEITGYIDRQELHNSHSWNYMSSSRSYTIDS